MRDKYGFNSHGIGSELFSKETAKEAAIVGAIALAMGGVAYQHRHDGEVKHPPAPIEHNGKHHSSAGMRSERHLQNFAAEHGINLNQK
jgi:hypothetical protein